MKIEILAIPGVDGADAEPIICPTWVRGDLAKTRCWALAKAGARLSPPVELVELRRDGESEPERWRPKGDEWIQDDA